MKTTVVFTARRAGLEKARKLLAAKGVSCRITRPRHQEGLLRVGLADGEHARALLAAVPDGRVLPAAEAAWFQCQACGANLGGGEFHCPNCQAVVGDPHGC